MNDIVPEYISGKDLAAVLGVSPKMIAKRSFDLIGRVKIGSAVRYNLAEIRSCLSSGRVFMEKQKKAQPKTDEEDARIDTLIDGIEPAAGADREETFDYRKENEELKKRREDVQRRMEEVERMLEETK